MDRVKWLLDAVTGSLWGVTVEYEPNGGLALKEISSEKGESILADNTVELHQLQTSSKVSRDNGSAEESKVGESATIKQSQPTGAESVSKVEKKKNKKKKNKKGKKGKKNKITPLIDEAPESGPLLSKLVPSPPALSESVIKVTTTDGRKLVPNEKLTGGNLEKLITPKVLYGSSHVHKIPCDTKGKLNTARKNKLPGIDTSSGRTAPNTSADNKKTFFLPEINADKTSLVQNQELSKDNNKVTKCLSGLQTDFDLRKRHTNRKSRNKRKFQGGSLTPVPEESSEDVESANKMAGCVKTKLPNVQGPSMRYKSQQTNTDKGKTELEGAPHLKEKLKLPSEVKSHKSKLKLPSLLGKKKHQGKVIIPKGLIGNEPTAKTVPHFPSFPHKRNKVKPMDMYSPKLPQYNSLDVNTKVTVDPAKNPGLPGWWHEPIPERPPARHGRPNACHSRPKCEERSSVHKEKLEKPVRLTARDHHVFTWDEHLPRIPARPAQPRTQRSRAAPTGPARLKEFTKIPRPHEAARQWTNSHETDSWVEDLDF